MFAINETPGRCFLYRLRYWPAPYKMFKDVGGAPFDAALYSRFKYGSGAAARRLGRALAERFFFSYPPSFWYAGTHLVASSAFKVVPTAAFALTGYFLERFNELLKSIGVKPAQLFKIERENIFSGDYANLEYQARREIVFQNKIVFNVPTVEAPRLWIIDDVRVTGLHEASLANALRKIGGLSFGFLYVAELLDGVSRPGLESELNAAYVSRLTMLETVVNESPYHLNARACKYLLSYPNANELSAFLNKRSLLFLHQLKCACIADGYSEMLAHQANYKLVEKYLELVPA